MFRIILGCLIIRVFTFPIMASEDHLERQKQWSSNHMPVRGVIGTANPTVNPEELFQSLSIETMPRPELFHLYIRTNGEEAYQLVRDLNTQTTKLIRLYGTIDEENPNFTTMSLPSSSAAKETLINPRKSTDLYKGDRKYPTTVSTSYPTEVRTYYVTVKGKKIRLDRGHGVPHADTLQHSGVVSTQDSENYTPQNIKYNSPIRRDLEDALRSKGLKYKEISIYHDDCMCNVTARVNSRDKEFRIPIPEGFIFLTFAEDGEIGDTYYFPNLVDYEELKGDRPNYAHFLDLYRIQNLSEWFLLPTVTLGLTDEHQDKVFEAEEAVLKILFSRNLFGNLSEEQMPPKARVALSATLLQWNMETAATLEFLTFKHQFQLANFYLTSQRSLWQFDDRYESEKRRMLDEFLGDEEVSSEARNLVYFIQRHYTFRELQVMLQFIISEIDGIYEQAPFHWTIPEFYPYRKGIKSKDGGKKLIINITAISLNDLPKIKKIIGGYVNHNTSRAQRILSVIDERARKASSTITEKLNLLRLYRDNKDLTSGENQLYWEGEIFKHVTRGIGITLQDRRRVVDYYSYRKMKTERDFWLQRFVAYIQENPTIENFLSIAEWCCGNQSAFLEDREEGTTPRTTAKMLALMLFKAINCHIGGCSHGNGESEDIDIIRAFIEKLHRDFGYYESDVLNFKGTCVVYPLNLDPLITGTVGAKLKQLYYIFLKTFCPNNIQKSTQLSPEGLIEALKKNSADYRNEAIVYFKLGFREEARKAAKECFHLASVSFEFKEAALALQTVGIENIAKEAAFCASNLAKDYKDYVHAMEAFHVLGEKGSAEEAKKKCFEIIGNKWYEFMFIAVDLYKAGLIDFAKEAARIHREHANLHELNGARQIYEQNRIADLAIETAFYILESGDEEKSKNN